MKKSSIGNLGYPNMRVVALERNFFVNHSQKDVLDNLSRMAYPILSNMLYPANTSVVHLDIRDLNFISFSIF